MQQKTCHTFAIVSLVCAGVSLIFFGAILDVVGFIFGIIAYVNIKNIIQSGHGSAAATNTLKLAKIGLILCLVAAIANVLTAAFLAPTMAAGTNMTGPTF